MVTSSIMVLMIEVPRPRLAVGSLACGFQVPVSATVASNPESPAVSTLTRTSLRAVFR